MLIEKSFTLSEDIQKTLSSQQTVLADILLKLSKMEKQLVQLPLLPTPIAKSRPIPISTSPSAAAHQTSLPSQSQTHVTSSYSLDTPANTQLCLPKLEIPSFSGENVLSWLF